MGTPVPEDQFGGPSHGTLPADISRVEAELAELHRQAQELRAELGPDSGPMDGNERAAILTRAEELESFAYELEGRRDSLLKKLAKSS